MSWRFLPEVVSLFDMSLINEALKQAQRESQGPNAPAVRDADVSTANKSRGGPNFAVIAVVLLAVGGAGAWFVLRDTPAPADTRAAVTTPVPTRPAEPAPKAPEPAVTVTPPAPPVVPVAAIVKPAEPAAPVVPAEPEAPVAPAAPVQNPQVLQMMSLMRLSMVRKSTNRAVIDGVVVKVGDRLSEQPPLVLAEVTDNSVIFKDGEGVSYEKRLIK